jgi:hypothetical protein
MMKKYLKLLLSYEKVKLLNLNFPSLLRMETRGGILISLSGSTHQVKIGFERHIKIIKKYFKKKIL